MGGDAAVSGLVGGGVDADVGGGVGLGAEVVVWAVGGGVDPDVGGGVDSGVGSGVDPDVGGGVDTMVGGGVDPDVGGGVEVKQFPKVKVFSKPKLTPPPSSCTLLLTKRMYPGLDPPSERPSPYVSRMVRV